MRTLNLAIVAHVDAGKTSLTERLLHAVGVTDTLGSVDRGDTRTDSSVLERRRGITISSAVVSFVVDDVVVDLIDTPGHPDFIAEVERVLNVLDGAVLVVSAVEGVQGQTLVLMRTLRRLGIPTLVFVNKIDRPGARVDRVADEVSTRLSPLAVPVGWVAQAGTRRARFTPYEAGDGDADLAAASRAGRAYPVLFGSAITGAGVEELIAALTRWLPTPEPDVAAPLSGTVFKIERGPTGEKIVYVRIFTGRLAVRDRLPGQGGEVRVSAISVFEGGAAVSRPYVEAGRIATVRGLTGARIGDQLGGPGRAPASVFAPPTLATVVSPVRPADRGALHDALVRLAEQDPLITLRQDRVRQELSVSLYGEVQKEVLESVLQEEFGLAVTFAETTTVCVERLLGPGSAVEVIDVAPNPFLATVGLRLEPGPAGSGVEFRLAVERGAMPAAFFRAVEETVRETLQQGLHGWVVPDCVVTMTRSGYYPRQSHAHAVFDRSMSSTAGDFRGLTPLVVMAALRRAGTEVLEPVHQVELEVPVDTLSAVLAELERRSGVPGTAVLAGESYALDAAVPAVEIHRLSQVLPALTHGEGVMESAFTGYRGVRGPVPTRSRTDADPLDRKEYLLHVGR